MQMPLQITIRDVPHSEAVEAHVREKAAKLEEFSGHIISCRVVVEMPHKHSHQGRQFNVRLDIGVPGNEIVVNRDRDEDVYIAIRDAFDAAKRQLEDYARRVRHDVKTHAPAHVGRVVRLSREEGIGFIAGGDGTEYYFSSADVVAPRFEQLREGDEVQFVSEVAGEGMQAKRVTVGHHHQAD
jgi:ribosomal subunit interface protein